MIEKPRGTRDVLFEDTVKWQYVEKIFKDVCSSFGFNELRTPTFEKTDLFLRGVGETSDIVSKQMYTFDDLGGRSLTLKPEGTAGIVRAILENKIYAGPLPIKVFYETPCFRYEKPQEGRLREFHQFGVEIFGSDKMLADATIIKIANDFFKRLDIKVTLEINSIGCTKCRPTYKDALIKYFSDRTDDLCPTCLERLEKNPMRILDCKSEKCKEVASGAPVCIDYLCDECNDDFDSLKKTLGNMNIEYEINPRIVRGLDYYTKTAFEFLSNSDRSKSTICGGGRYDNLANELGGIDLKAVGFGLGVERLLLENIDFKFDKKNKYLIVPMTDEAMKQAIDLGDKLRGEGNIVLFDEACRNVKNQFKYGDKEGADFVIVIGEDELSKGVFTIKDLKTGEQKEQKFL